MRWFRALPLPFLALLLIGFTLTGCKKREVTVVPNEIPTPESTTPTPPPASLPDRPGSPPPPTSPNAPPPVPTNPTNPG